MKRNYLIELRGQVSASQASIAKQLDVSQQYYAAIELGRRQQKMDIVFIRQLAEVFDVSVDWIIQQEMLVGAKDISERTMSGMRPSI